MCISECLRITLWYRCQLGFLSVNSQDYDANLTNSSCGYFVPANALKLASVPPLFVDFLREELCKQEPQTEEEQNLLENIERRNAALKTPECQRIVEKVLENTVFNLMQEASHKEIDLTTHTTFLYPTDEWLLEQLYHLN